MYNKKTECLVQAQSVSYDQNHFQLLLMCVSLKTYPLKCCVFSETWKSWSEFWKGLFLMFMTFQSLNFLCRKLNWSIQIPFPSFCSSDYSDVQDLRAQNCWKTSRIWMSISLVNNKLSNVLMYLNTRLWCWK